MQQAFKKVSCFTDIHFGLKHNARVHNNDCENFVNWFCDESVKRGADTCIFLGDWHHHRNTINVSTLNYTISNLQKLSETFKTVYIIVGNHDLYYREKREIHSLPMGKHLSNVILVDKKLNLGDVTIVPWLVEDEWKTIPNIKSKYLFGHFEIPGFKMNALVEMLDNGGVNSTHFKNQEYVFSGHFHKRQTSGNIHYIGNPFGHNFADAGEFNRGAMFLEWGGVPEYVNWEDGPTYISTHLSALIEDPQKHCRPNSYIKAVLDIELSYEEVAYIKELFVKEYNVRELKLIPDFVKDEHEGVDSDDAAGFESVDTIITNQLASITSETYDVKKLIEIYDRL